MANETRVQEIIHRLEEGGWSRWIWFLLVGAAVIYISSAWFFRENGFRGLKEPHAFEQAVIAREIARGHGFSTRIVRPAELWLFREHKQAYPAGQVPDTYHAPLWPTVLAPFLLSVQKTWKMTEADVGYTSDRVIAGVALGFFLLSVVIIYFIARRLFDFRLACMAGGMMLLCDRCWRYAMSGLPQMLLLFLFSATVYALVRLLETYLARQNRTAWLVEEAREDLTQGGQGALPGEAEAAAEAAPAEEPRAVSGRTLPLWSAATGVGFGLLALAHGLTIWILAGLIFFCLFYLREARRAVVLPLLGCFLLLYTPWLVRNYQVCGVPTGVSWYSVLYQVRGTENSIMRSRESSVANASPSMFRRKIQDQTISQLGDLPSLLGGVLLAPVFFVALLHPFKRRSTALLRWAILFMWLFALLGMAAFGLEGGGLGTNDLHVLFIPFFTFYGLGFVLVLWSRLEIRVRLLRISFIILLFVTSALPFIATALELHSPPIKQVEWPPYIPPYIAILGKWTKDPEIIMSDMPWAVAWYADRKSLWLPTTVKDFNELNDYQLLSAPIVGLYLTPVSGDAPFLNGILAGDYQDWAPFILRSNIPRNFAFRAVTPLPVQNQCTFYADRDRWSSRED